MAAAAASVRETHPDFEYTLFDDDMCRQFIASKFPPIVLYAFDSLVPGAYRADLWRYCILFIEGGIYLDIKYTCISGFTFHELLDRPHYVYDENFMNIYNALIAVPPKSPVLSRCIQQIIVHVRTRFYGPNMLSPTGPALLSRCLPKDLKPHIQMYHCFLRPNKYILFMGAAVLKMVPQYYEEQDQHKKVEHYPRLWHEKQIYRQIALPSTFSEEVRTDCTSSEQSSSHLPTSL